MAAAEGEIEVMRSSVRNATAESESERVKSVKCFIDIFFIIRLFRYDSLSPFGATFSWTTTTWYSQGVYGMHWKPEIVRCSKQ